MVPLHSLLFYHKPIVIAKLSPEELKQEKLVIDPFYNYRRDRKDTVHLQKNKRPKKWISKSFIEK